MLLGTINRWLRVFGVVLVVEHAKDGDDEPTRLYFQRASRWPLVGSTDSAPQRE